MWRYGGRGAHHSELPRLTRQLTVTTSSLSSVGTAGSCSGTVTFPLTAGHRCVTAEGGAVSRGPKQVLSLASGWASKLPKTAPPLS